MIRDFKTIGSCQEVVTFCVPSISVRPPSTTGGPRGIQAAIALPSTRFSNDLWIFIDNLEVAKKFLTKNNSTSSQEIFLDALEAVKIWKSRTRLPQISEGEIKVRRVPSHAGIEGNELADAEAKKGAATPFQNNQSKLSIAALALWKSSQMCQAREKW
ncbi:hypothetical protein K3495_g10530 [Podosphaera aphanis]|nr:hypothetical protein K3495_g10530 [Podosphaera aphanis]